MLVWNIACEWAKGKGMDTMCLFFIQKGKGRPHEAENQKTTRPTSCGS